MLTAQTSGSIVKYTETKESGLEKGERVSIVLPGSQRDDRVSISGSGREFNMLPTKACLYKTFSFNDKEIISLISNTYIILGRS